MIHTLANSIKKVRRPLWLSVFLCLSLAVTPGVANATQASKWQPAGIKITSPKSGARIATAPVEVKVQFKGTVRDDSFRAKLNGRDVTDSFQVDASGATASLDQDDGVRVSPDGKSWRTNVLLVSIQGKHWWSHYHDKSVFFVKAKSAGQQVSGVITPQGGTLTLPGIGEVTFPAGAFTTDTTVYLSASADPAIAQKFDETAGSILGAGVRLPYELHVRTGQVQPLLDPQVTFTLPDSFRSTVPAGSEIRVFAENYWEGPEELLDTFEVLTERFTATDTAALVTVPRSFFTNGLRADGEYELIATAATTPTAAPVTPISAARTTLAEPGQVTVDEPAGAAGSAGATDEPAVKPLQSADPCEGTTLDQPLDGTLEVTSPFGTRTHPITGAVTGHFGTDLRAADGTTVRSMADGVVERVANNTNTNAAGQTTGWGQYVVVRHNDGSKSLYAHLQSGSPVALNTPVRAGDAVGLSDTSGGATGPHLHVEYAPNGQIFDRAAKVDPMPCIGGNVTGSITVRDNGNLADDAFSVAIDGLVVCTTAIGASNTCAVGKLRPGTKTLTLTAVIAPDDLGTYQISLGNGLTFSDNSTTVSGVIAQGASASYSIIVPAPPAPTPKP